MNGSKLIILGAVIACLLDPYHLLPQNKEHIIYEKEINGGGYVIILN